MEFLRDLRTLFAIEVYSILEKEDWDKYFFYLKMGLDPESMLIHIASWENRLFFDHILASIDSFTEEYAGTSAIDFAIYQNEPSLFYEVAKRNPYPWDSLTTVLDVNGKKWVDLFLTHFDGVTVEDFFKAACEYEDVSFASFLVKEKKASLKKIKDEAQKESNEEVLSFLRKHFPEL